MPARSGGAGSFLRRLRLVEHPFIGEGATAPPATDREMQMTNGDKLSEMELQREMIMAHVTAQVRKEMKASGCDDQTAGKIVMARPYNGPYKW